MQQDIPPASGTGQPARRLARLFSLVAIGFCLIVLLIAWQWYESRGQQNALREEIVRRVRDSETDSRDARLVAKQAQEALRETQVKLAQLEVKLAESKDRQVALESLYQDLSRNRDEWVLAEVEQILTLASQQLQLAGNAQAALAALRSADARLARSRSPQLLPLRKVFARDMERLKAAPGPDLADLASRLDQLVASVDSLPLAQDARPGATNEAGAAQEQEGLLERLWTGFLGELKQLVRIQNTGRSDPVLLGPSQVFFLRENLKLRLLNARLALLARDEVTYRSDLKTAASWLERYFDTRSRATSTAIGSLNRLGSGSAPMSPPSIAESLAAVRGYRAPQPRREQ
jgi:uroporphyrin-III C-methyltransferase